MEREWKHIVLVGLGHIIAEGQNPGRESFMLGRTSWVVVPDIEAMAVQKLHFRLRTTAVAVACLVGSPKRENHFGY